MRLIQERPGSSVHWVVFSANEARALEARSSAAAFTAGTARVDVQIHGYRESYFPFQGEAIKATFEVLARDLEPDVVLSHRRDDEHQDHQTIGKLTWNHFRDHLILEYEIAKYEGDLGHPNLFFPLARDVVDAKVDLLLEHFRTQREKHWFSPETFRGLMAVRGVECNAPSGFAEAFHLRKAMV
jgi:LmbE family N-acetylglucosaminyl deacetylase